MNARQCVLCGCLVEPEPTTPNGLALVTDRRMPAGHALLAPTLCWECRGGVILGAYAGR